MNLFFPSRTLPFSGRRGKSRSRTDPVAKAPPDEDVCSSFLAVTSLLGSGILISPAGLHASNQQNYTRASEVVVLLVDRRSWCVIVVSQGLALTMSASTWSMRAPSPTPRTTAISLTTTASMAHFGVPLARLSGLIWINKQRMGSRDLD